MHRWTHPSLHVTTPSCHSPPTRACQTVPCTWSSRLGPVRLHSSAFEDVLVIFPGLSKPATVHRIEEHLFAAILCYCRSRRVQDSARESLSSSAVALWVVSLHRFFHAQLALARGRQSINWLLRVEPRGLVAMFTETMGRHSSNAIVPFPGCRVGRQHPWPHMVIRATERLQAKVMIVVTLVIYCQRKHSAIISQKLPLPARLSLQGRSSIIALKVTILRAPEPRVSSRGCLAGGVSRMPETLKTGCAVKCGAGPTTLVALS